MDVITRPGASTASLMMAELCTVVRSVAAQPGAWNSPLDFDASGGWSRLLYANDHYDLWVLTWVPGQQTEVHDHGGSASAFTVLRGSLVELRPNARGRLLPELLPIGFTRWVAPHAVHQVRNAEARTPAVSVHAYSPPLRTMSMYEARHGRLVRQRTDEVKASAAVGVA